MPDSVSTFARGANLIKFSTKNAIPFVCAKLKNVKIRKRKHVNQEPGSSATPSSTTPKLAPRKSSRKGKGGKGKGKSNGKGKGKGKGRPKKSAGKKSSGSKKSSKKRKGKGSKTVGNF